MVMYIFLLILKQTVKCHIVLSMLYAFCQDSRWYGKSGILGNWRQPGKGRKFVGKVREFLTYQLLTKPRHWSSSRLPFLVILKLSTNYWMRISISGSLNKEVLSKIKRNEAYFKREKLWKFSLKVRKSHGMSGN